MEGLSIVEVSKLLNDSFLIWCIPKRQCLRQTDPFNCCGVCFCPALRTSLPSPFPALPSGPLPLSPSLYSQDCRGYKRFTFENLWHTQVIKRGCLPSAEKQIIYHFSQDSSFIRTCFNTPCQLLGSTNLCEGNSVTKNILENLTGILFFFFNLRRKNRKPSQTLCLLDRHVEGKKKCLQNWSSVESSTTPHSYSEWQ